MVTMTPTTEYINKNFRIVFEPKDKAAFNNNRRFGVGAGKLAEYIGADNAATCFKKSDEITTDKIRIKFRKMGIVDFYVK